MFYQNIFQRFAQCSTFLTVIFIPIVLSPLIFLRNENGEFDQKFQCAFVILLVALYYMVEAIPLPAAGLIPILLFPLFGIQDTAKVTIEYMRPTTAMLLCGLIIAAAIEYSNLHKRIALRILLLIGTSKQRLAFSGFSIQKLTLGIMLTTMSYSMFLSNMSTTAFMCPIALAIVDGLMDDSTGEKSEIVSNHENNTIMNHLGNDNFTTEKDFSTKVHPQDVEAGRGRKESNEKSSRTLKKLFLFGVAYSSNIGGTGSIMGTAVNYNLIEYLKLDEDSSNAASTLNFGTWILVNFPLALICTFIAWLYLTTLYLGVPNWICFWRPKKEPTTYSKQNRLKVTKMLQKSYDDMGDLTFQEKAIAGIFLLVVSLCFFRRPRFMPGWSDLIKKTVVNDATVFVLGVLLLFMIPKKLSYFKGKSCGTLVNWKYVQNKVPWGILLVNGSAFAMANNAKKSGLSNWVGESLKGIGDLPDEAILLIAILITTIATEFVSNQAVANIMLPILISISEKLGIHPLYLTLPATVTCSFGFMLPAATNSNTIVFGTGYIGIFDMLRTGAFMNIILVMFLQFLNLQY